MENFNITDSSHRLLDNAEPTLLEATFFKGRSYTVRTAQLAQQFLCGGLVGSFFVGALTLPWADSHQKAIAISMLVGMVATSAALCANYLFYNQVYKPYHQDYIFHPIKGPIQVNVPAHS